MTRAGAIECDSHGDWYGPGLSFCGHCGICGRCNGSGVPLVARLHRAARAAAPTCRHCRSTGRDPDWASRTGGRPDSASSRASQPGPTVSGMPTTTTSMPLGPEHATSPAPPYDG